MPTCAADGAGGERVRDGLGGRDPAGGDEREVGRAADAPPGASRSRVGVGGRVGERAPVPAGLAALDDERVDAGRRRLPLPRPREVTVHQTALPAARSVSTTSRPGQPNVNETTAGRSRASSSSFASQSSSVQRGSPGSTPYRSASPRSRSAYAASAPSSTCSRTGKKTLTPNGRPVSRRTSAISSATAPAVL